MILNWMDFFYFTLSAFAGLYFYISYWVFLLNNRFREESKKLQSYRLHSVITCFFVAFIVVNTTFIFTTTGVITIIDGIMTVLFSSLLIVSVFLFWKFRANI